MLKLAKAVIVLAALSIFSLGLIVSCQQQDTGEMASAQAKATVDKILQFWNEGKLDLADEIYAAGVVRHDMGLNKDFEGVEAQKELVTTNRTAFPDLKLDIIETIVKGDTLVEMWKMTGTNTGPMNDMPATGKMVQFEGISLVHLTDGKAVEIWDFYNQLYILEQLGFTVTPPAPPEMEK